MEGNIEVPSREISRRSFLRGAAATAITSIIAPSSTATIAESIARAGTIFSQSKEKHTAELLARRLRYGINLSFEDRKTLDDAIFKGEIELQKYDLSCEFAAVTYMLRAKHITDKEGRFYSEDDLIDRTPSHVFPWYGFHPELRDKSLNNSNRFGEIPPKPYGIFPQPLATMLSESGILPDNLDAIYGDNKNISESKVSYLQIIKGQLANGFPVVSWFTNANNYKDLRPTPIGPDVVVKDQHAALITGIGDEFLEMLDPLNNKEYMYMPLDEFYERARLNGLGLLSLIEIETNEE